MKISVIGSGSRGLALSDVLAYNGNDVLVYARDSYNAHEINTFHTAQKYLGDISFDKKIKATSNLKECLEFSNYLVIAVPSKSIIQILKKIKSKKNYENYFFINATKGFSKKNTIQETIDKYFPIRRGLVSVLGPGFAKEVINKNITCICSVSKNEKEALFVQALFSNNYFRVYTQTDVIGAEIYSSMKNAIAIASGMVAGLGYNGANTKSCLITQGLKEMSIIGNILGAKEETFFGLTGLGDLMLTCSSDESRNFQAGFRIGKDNSAKKFLKHNSITVEGIATIKVIEGIRKKHKLDLPILHALYLVIYKNKKPLDMLKKIMHRPLTNENHLYKQIKQP